GLTAAIQTGGNNTSLPISIAISSNAPIGTQTISVITANGTSSAFAGFVVTFRPTITSISPPSLTGGPATPATIFGQTLSGATAVTFSGTGVTASITDNSFFVAANVAVASNAVPGMRSVTVTTPVGTTDSFPFTISPSAGYLIST